MRRANILLPLALAACGPIHPRTVRREGAYLAVQATDWRQSRTIAAHPDRFQEANRVLGNHPSRAAVDRYFLAASLLHAGAVAALPDTYRARFQWLSLSLEASCIAMNAQDGAGGPRIGYNHPVGYSVAHVSGRFHGLTH